MNNPIKLYRDADIRDSGKPFIPSGSLEEQLEMAYNKGLEDAVREVSEVSENYPGDKTIDGKYFTNPTRNALHDAIELIESLKKKP